MAILDVLDPSYFCGQNQSFDKGLVKTGDGTISNISLDTHSNSLDDSKSVNVIALLDTSFSDSVTSQPVKTKVLKAKGCEINLGKYLLPGHSDSDSDDEQKKANMTKTEVVHYTEALFEEYWDSSIEKWFHPRTGKHLHMQEAIDCGILCPEIVRVKQANGQTINLQKAINSGQINVHTGKTINLKTALTWPFHVAVAKGLVKINDNEPMQKCDMYTELGPGVVSLIARKELLRETKLLDKRLDQWLDIPSCVEGFIFDTEWGKVKDNMTGKWYSWEEAKEAGLILDPRVGEQSSMSDEEILRLCEEGNHIVNLKEVIDETGAKEYGGHVLFNQNPAKQNTGRRPSADLDKPAQTLAQRRCSLATDNRSQLTTFPVMLDEAIKLGLYNPVTNKLKIPGDNTEVPLESALQRGLINKESLVRDPVSRDILSLEEAIDKRIIDPASGKMIDANEQAIALNFAFKTGLIMRSQSPLKLSMSEILDEGLFDEELGTFLNPDDNQEITFGEAINSGLIDKDLMRVRNTETGQVLKLDDAVELGMIYYDSGVCVDMTTRQKLQIPDCIERGILIDTANQPKMSLQSAIEQNMLNFTNGTFFDNDLGIEVCLGDALESGLIDADSVLVRDPKTLTVLTIDAAINERIIDPVTGLYTNDNIEVGFGEAIDKGLVLYNALHGVLPCSVLEAIRFNIYDEKTQKFVDPKSGMVLSLENAIEVNLIDPRKTMVKDTSTGRFLSLMNAEYLGVVNLKKSEITDIKNNKQGELKNAKETGLLRRSASEECLTLKTAISKGLVDKGKVQDMLSRQEMNLIDAIQIRIIDHTPTLVKDVRHGKFVPLLDAIRMDLIDVNEGMFIDSETGNAVSLVEACEIGNIIEIPASGLTLAEIVEHGLYKPEVNSFHDVRTGKMISLQDGIEQRFIDPSRPQVVVPGTGLLSLKDAFELGYLDKSTGKYLVGGEEITLKEAVEKFLVVTVGSKRRNNKSMTESFCEELDDGKTWNDLLVKHPYERMFMSMEDAIEYGVIDIQTESYCNPQTGDVEPVSVAMSAGEVVDAGNPKFGLASALELKIFDPVTNLVLDPRTNEDIPLQDALRCGLIDTVRSRVKDLETGHFISLKQALKKGIVSNKTGSLLEKTQKRTFPIESAVGDGLVVDFMKSNFTVPEGISLGMITHDGLMVEDLNTGNYLCLDDAVARGVIDTDNTLVKQNDGETEMTLGEAIKQDVVDECSGVMKLKTGRRLSLAEAVSKSYIGEKKDANFFSNEENRMTNSLNIPSLDESDGIESFLPRILNSPLFKAESLNSLGGRSDSIGSPIRFDEALKFGFIDLETGDFTDYLTDTKVTIEQAANEGRLSIRKVSFFDEENKLSVPLKFALERNLLIQVAKPQNHLSDSGPKPKKGLTFQQAIDKGLLTIQTELSDSVDMDNLSVKSDTFSEMIVKNKHLDWLSSTKAVSSSLDSLIKNVKEDQSGFRVGTLFGAIEKGLYNDKAGTLTDNFTKKNLKIKEAMSSGLISSKAPEVLDPRSDEFISLEEAVKRRLVDAESGMFNHPVSCKKMSLTEAKEEGYIIKTESNLHSKSSVEIYVEEILSNESSRGKNKLQEAFSTGVLNRSKSQVIDPDMVKPITMRRAGSLGMIDSKTGEFKNPQTGESCSLAEAVQKGFILSPKGLSLYSAVNQGLYCEENGLFKDPETGKGLSLNSLILSDIITDSCMEIRDVEGDGSVIKLRDAIRRGVIDGVKGMYISNQSKLNFKEAISAGLIISNIPREGLRESSSNVETIIGNKPEQVWKFNVQSRETLKDGPSVQFNAKDSKKVVDSKVTSSTSSMETNSSGYETNMSQNQNNVGDDIRFAVEIDQLKAKQVYLNMNDDVLKNDKYENKDKLQISNENTKIIDETPRVRNKIPDVNSERPEGMNEKSSIGNESRVHGNEKLMISDEKPEKYDKQKSCDKIPRISVDKPETNDEKLKSRNEKHTISSEKRKAGDEKSKNSIVKPKICNEKPKTGNERPMINNEKPELCDEKTRKQNEKTWIAGVKSKTDDVKTGINYEKTNEKLKLGNNEPKVSVETPKVGIEKLKNDDQTNERASRSVMKPAKMTSNTDSLELITASKKEQANELKDKDVSNELKDTVNKPKKHEIPAEGDKLNTAKSKHNKPKAKTASDAIFVKVPKSKDKKLEVKIANDEVQKTSDRKIEGNFETDIVKGGVSNKDSELLLSGPETDLYDSEKARGLEVLSHQVNVKGSKLVDVNIEVKSKVNENGNIDLIVKDNKQMESINDSGQLENVISSKKNEKVANELDAAAVAEIPDYSRKPISVTNPSGTAISESGGIKVKCDPTHNVKFEDSDYEKRPETVFGDKIGDLQSDKTSFNDQNNAVQSTVDNDKVAAVSGEDLNSNKTDGVTKKDKLLPKLNVGHNIHNGSFDQELNVPSPAPSLRSLVSPVRGKEFVFHAGVPQSVREERQVNTWNGNDNRMLTDCSVLC